MINGAAVSTGNVAAKPSAPGKAGVFSFAAIGRADVTMNSSVNTSRMFLSYRFIIGFRLQIYKLFYFNGINFLHNIRDFCQIENLCN